MKRAFDIIIASIALVLLALPLLALTWLVRSKLGNPAFFRQVRPGLHGKPFEMIKLPYGDQVLWPDHCVQGTEGAAVSKERKLVIASL